MIPSQGTDWWRETVAVVLPDDDNSDDDNRNDDNRDDNCDNDGDNRGNNSRDDEFTITIIRTKTMITWFWKCCCWWQCWCC